MMRRPLVAWALTTGLLFGCGGEVSSPSTPDVITAQVDVTVLGSGDADAAEPDNLCDRSCTSMTSQP